MPWLMATVYDWFMRDLEAASVAEWRAELIRPLRGDVLEIGAGTGRNFDQYRHLGRLVVAEPDAHMRKKLEARVSTASACARSIEIASFSAERIESPDASFDVVVSTLVLCSVEDPGRALREMHRVLRPGGKLVFLEHVRSNDRSRFAWQRRLEPIWKRIAGNCHLCRDTEREIRDASFRIERLVHESARKAPPIVRGMVRGVAVKD